MRLVRLVLVWSIERINSEFYTMQWDSFVSPALSRSPTRVQCARSIAEEEDGEWRGGGGEESVAPRTM